MDGDIRVVVAAHHYKTRETTRRDLEDVNDFDVVATVGTTNELEHVVQREDPDVVLTELRMPADHDTEMAATAQRIHLAHPDVGLVVLSPHHPEAEYLMELTRCGTDGLAYLLQERVGHPDQLVASVRTVSRGGSWIDVDVVRAMMNKASHHALSPLRTLTRQESEVLKHAAQGLTSPAIANHLNLSQPLIEQLHTNLSRKLGLTREPHEPPRVTAILHFLHEQSRPLPRSSHEGQTASI